MSHIEKIYRTAAILLFTMRSGFPTVKKASVRDAATVPGRRSGIIDRPAVSDACPGPLGVSLIGTAWREQGLWALETVDIRAHSPDKRGFLDDTPAGGGPGPGEAAGPAAVRAHGGSIGGVRGDQRGHGLRAADEPAVAG